MKPLLLLRVGYLSLQVGSLTGRYARNDSEMTSYVATTALVDLGSALH